MKDFIDAHLARIVGAAVVWGTMLVWHILRVAA